MSKIASLMATETVVDVEFPDIEGFIISLVYLNREDLVKIRNQSLTFKFNKRTRQREEEIDNDKFLAAYTEKAIKDWKGHVSVSMAPRWTLTAGVLFILLN